MHVGTEVTSDFDEVSYVAGIAACKLQALDGATLRVRDAWAGKTVVHVFLRQFGCLFCHETVAQMLAASSSFVAAGAHLVLVGSGSVDQASRFARAKQLPRDGVAIYADPTQASFEAASLVRGMRHVFFNTGSVRAYVRAKIEGFRITGVAGDVSQLGGLLVVEPPARLRYLHRSAFAGDHPSTEQILDALT